ncbi:MAG: hypothetical protein ACP5UV_02915 [Thermoplasmata archaeon]
MVKEYHDGDFLAITSADEASNVAKSWAYTQFGIDSSSVNVLSASERSDSTWFVRISFIMNNEEKRYSVTIDGEGTVVNFANLQQTPSPNMGMGSAPTMILVAEIFSALIVLVFLVEAIFSFFAFSVYSIMYIIFLLIGIYIFLRIQKMRTFIKNGDARSALDIDTVGLGVIALIFNGIIPGLLLLIARGDIEAAAGQ